MLHRDLRDCSEEAWRCSCWLFIAAVQHSTPLYSVFQKKRHPFLLLRQLRQMSPDLADFGHDYRSVNLQRPSAYLLIRNGNIFGSRVPA